MVLFTNLATETSIIHRSKEVFSVQWNNNLQESIIYFTVLLQDPNLALIIIKACFPPLHSIQLAVDVFKSVIWRLRWCCQRVGLGWNPVNRDSWCNNCFNRDNLWLWQEQVKSCKFKIAKAKINGCISEAHAYSLRKQLEFFNNTTDFLAKWQLKNKTSTVQKFHTDDNYAPTVPRSG